MATPPSIVSGIFFAGVTPFSNWNGIFLNSNSIGEAADEPCAKKDGKTKIDPSSRSIPEHKVNFAKDVSFIAESHDQISSNQRVGSCTVV
jgi:hypothetical protein